MRPDDRRLLRGIADQETARLRDGTRPWSWWLERAVLHGRHHGYTAILLIGAQWRGATDVRSYDAWRSAGRQVRKGETGIRVLGRTGAPRAVFDISQTEGLPLSERRDPPPPDAESRLTSLVAQAPGRGVRRVEADSVAFLVASWLGLEPPMPAFPARAFWAGPGIGDRILRTARRVHGRVSGAPRNEIMADAERFFHARLTDDWVPDYLSGRGFPPGVQRRWRIGYAPSGPRALTDHLRRLGHTDEDITAAGLARPTDASGPSPGSGSGSGPRPGNGEGIRDTFRDRAMFAIRSPDGAVTGFIGRRRDDAPGPKYLNGPATSLFHKGELLYGLHEARDRLAAGARPVIVEGPLDAIAVTMAGPAEYAAVATCGLTLTAEQFDALADIADLDGVGVLLALDGDPAGRSGAVRVWERLAGVGGPVETATLPPGHDPAGVLASGGRAAVRNALRARTPLMDTVIDSAFDRAVHEVCNGPAATAAPSHTTDTNAPTDTAAPTDTNAHLVHREGGAFGSPEGRLAAIRAAARIIAMRPPEAARQVVRVAARADVPPALVTEILCETVSPVGRP
ncbi:DNA primase [Actinomadura pelletieri DSM 43383]|uniref:DNA primase n=1 Tax=Actinomadura pelletieri DSM 43383 TaxID=1120940 RepID=A0A495QIZ1_9ACTN|nr:toprim domain-containing protein [Actinomadura pelletieri]RKS72113.1 DNA primase [Actinomadura pelletieri DSM 43383]